MNKKIAISIGIVILLVGLTVIPTGTCVETKTNKNNRIKTATTTENECSGLCSASKAVLTSLDFVGGAEEKCYESIEKDKLIPKALGIIGLPIVTIAELIIFIPAVVLFPLMKLKGIASFAELDDLCDNWSRDDFDNIPDGFWGDS